MLKESINNVGVSVGQRKRNLSEINILIAGRNEDELWLSYSKFVTYVFPVNYFCGKFYVFVLN